MDRLLSMASCRNITLSSAIINGSWITNTLAESRFARFIDFHPRHFFSLISPIFLIGERKRHMTYSSSLSETIYNGCLHKNATLRYILIAYETICYTLFII
jgi:hypothetical protein